MSGCVRGIHITYVGDLKQFGLLTVVAFSNICRARYSVSWSQILDTFYPESKAALCSTLRDLRYSKTSIGRVSAEEPRVLSKLGGTHVPIR